MPIDFHSEQNRYTYASRQADSSWQEMIETIVDIHGKDVVDIGCGGGIYTKVFARMGAAHVSGIDFSQEMLKGAGEYCQGYNNVTFSIGNALATGLPAEQYDVILERAITHHLKREELAPCFAEALRLLRSGGMLIVQNRTPEDCSLPATTTHVRGYFFERYPRLLAKETARRPDSATITKALQQAGFRAIEERKLWELVQVYPDVTTLTNSLQTRTGRSILHELNDDELHDLVAYIRQQFARDDQEIVEEGRWTIWTASKL